MKPALLLCAVMVTACATASPPGAAPALPETVRMPGPGGGTMTAMAIQHTTSPAVRTYFRSAEDVWAALPAVYAALNIAVEDRNSDVMTIGNPSFKVRHRLADVPLGRYLDCGSTQGSTSADSYEILMSVQTQVQRDGAASSVVTTIVEARGRPIAFSSDYVTCGTRGELEKRFFTLLSAQLKE